MLRSWDALMAAAYRTLLALVKPCTYASLVAAVRTHLAPQEHRLHWQLTDRASRLYVFTVRAFITNYSYFLFQAEEAVLVYVRVFSLHVLYKPNRFPYLILVNHHDKLLVLHKLNSLRVVLELLKHFIVAT